MYVVYHIKSTMVHKIYMSESSARRSATAMNRRHPGQYNYAGLDDYNCDVVYMVERVNLITGEKYMEPSNTPAHCSPSTETYWSA